MNEFIDKFTKYFCLIIIECFNFIKRLYIYRFLRIKHLRIERSFLKNNENTNRKFLLRSIAFLLILLILIMLIPSKFMYFTGGQTKLELLEFIGWGMSGLIAIFGVMGLLQRATALDEQNKISEKGHIHERFKAATEHLGSKRNSVRIAAFYEFYRLAEIEPDLRKTIFDILCAHLRQTTKDDNYKDKPEPTEEVKDLLYILFNSRKDNFIFSGVNADLAEVNLQGVYLSSANLQNANLYKAKLQNIKILSINLQNANLEKATLHGAKINKKTEMQMPDGWQKIVIPDEDGTTGVSLMDDKGKFIRKIEIE